MHPVGKNTITSTLGDTSCYASFTIAILFINQRKDFEKEFAVQNGSGYMGALLGKYVSG